MAGKKMWLGVLAIALVFGMTVIGCDNGSTDSGTDSSLNGTWVSDSQEQEFKINNGNFEMSMDGSPYMKGTYTTSDSKITIIITDIHGGFMTQMSDGNLSLDSKWYSKNDLKTALEGFGMPAGEFEEQFENMFSEKTSTYSVSGNTLTMTDGEGEVTTATRK